MKRKLKRGLKYYLLRLFRLKAGPHQIAMGLTLGFVPNWFPTFGLGPMLSIALAKLTGVNLVAAVIGGVMGAPIWPILFLLNYKVGSFIFSEPSKVNDLNEVHYLEAVDETVSGLQHSGSLQYITGTFINIAVSSVLIYLSFYFLFRKYRTTILLKLR
ncbi:DUF2062 domain-containing protein [Ammoniphilus sp. CFH 90114]|uniref:DUF2062 domain-containing protein n=1 Tax=Ammoniphilus sp. CFH 90114 TaxID=2493665 RepID=UPI00100FE83C|nr:DUF2062 domain-containing protein [Ammoniphilus sp. CFH 90114]RXT04125.1 DUF2062 domain-containing protein [Ammoniphilus sp. CFH 90114]